jgi:RimJ/RimL family protein N-acetyltransferase
MTRADLPDLAGLELGSRTPEDWVAWNRRSYDELGFGLWVIETHAGEFVGDCGLTLQEVAGARLVEIGWHVATRHRRQGYAAEAAAAVRDAARDTGVEYLVAIVARDNLASQGVATRIGLVLEREVERRGARMLVYGADLGPAR